MSYEKDDLKTMPEDSRAGDGRAVHSWTGKIFGRFLFMEGEEMIKITKEISDGKTVYRDDRGEIITTYSESLEDVLDRTLVPLRDFLKMQTDVEDDDDLIRAAYIALALLERVEDKIATAADYIDKNYGRVEIEKASYRQSVIPETMLGVVFRPCQGVTA